MLAQHLTKPNLCAALLAAALFIYLIDALPLVNFIALLILNGAIYALYSLNQALPHTSLPRTLAHSGLWFACLILGFFIALYRPSDFNYPLAFHFTQLDFQLYANLGKGLAGALVLVWLWPRSDKAKNIWLSLALALVASSLVIASAKAMGIPWAFKTPSGIVWFLVINVALTVLAEEAFFRLLLQENLAKLLGGTKVAILSAALVSVAIFALAHVPPTHKFFALYLIAGGLYCAVYTYTRRLSMAVATHAAVNILHFTLLPYPLS
ncbi:CPBP family intramembrane metalloprotease [Gilvimarinus sp. SDUM040013]|uniref:CPBP family intramembrane glutamic endopeptidase n=1 Tax=Gilvimarinus gilvus TaxID=3058038 RepID=A0ABU4RZ31_9GAMM|nr:CPBP family intramembrane glutamic endopeptidase [Gilvimarinus sp. SDUM040013]MDO3387568.1 CPBP family intramembrane metalloprotease [Gilvimarinus sp. SDUM040013]MDX6850167.1 CPBP family intramembrane glutamic endopeptidase [Gilvimarinus sp. SDUM040013]